jgi:hypothetical protein
VGDGVLVGEGVRVEVEVGLLGAESVAVNVIVLVCVGLERAGSKSPHPLRRKPRQAIADSPRVYIDLSDVIIK